MSDEYAEEEGEAGEPERLPDIEEETRGEFEEEEEEQSARPDDEEPPPPPPEDDRELLFFIEFMVDTLCIEKEAFLSLPYDPCALMGQNCVVLTFMHFPPMSICETDMNADKRVGELQTVYNAGKSLVFALTESQFENPPPVFLQVAVFKEMSHAYQVPNIQLGKAKVDLSGLFRMVFDRYDEKPDQLPASKSIKDNYDLTFNGVVTGQISLYIRLTCLGENVVTEFQKSDGTCAPFLFKNLESPEVYKCMQTEESAAKTQSPVCQKHNGQQGDYEPDSEDENYEQIFAEINGSSILVNVEKSKRKPKKKPFSLKDFCDCQIPLPPDLVEGASELSVSQVSEVPYIHEIPDGGVGKCDNNLIFQVPGAGKLAAPDGSNNVKYRVASCKKGKEHGHSNQKVFKVVQEDIEKPPTLPNDPERDVFVLRIIKKGKSVDGKGAVEMEFKVPKEKIEPPPKLPYMIDREVGPERSKKDKKKKKN